jgi:predicted NACHT family NTPase
MPHKLSRGTAEKTVCYFAQSAENPVGVGVERFQLGLVRNSGYSRSLDRVGLCKQLQRISGLDCLSRDKNLMVVGKPGSGKTTYLQHIITECNDERLQSHRIPVFIKLREFVDDG